MKSKGVIAIIAAIVLVIGVGYFLNHHANVETPATAATMEAPTDAAAAATTETTPAAETTESVAAVSATAAGSDLAAPAALTVDVSKAMAERTIGQADAPVTIIEYASMTCSHCAHFSNEIFAEVKKQLIDTGKVRYVFRDFPLDAVAMKVAKMARCADADKFFDLNEVLFKNQERWVKADDPLKAAEQYGTLAGMDPQYIEACMNDEALDTEMVKVAKEAQDKYKVNATPTFVFNDGKESFSGAQPIEKFVETVNKLTAGQ